jgi:transposase
LYKNFKVIFVYEGKDSSTITTFSEDFQNHNGNLTNIKSACIDISPHISMVFSTELPNAEITFNKFHVMKAMNEGVNEVRKHEQKNKDLKNKKFLWLKNEKNLTKEQRKKLLGLRKQKFEILRAYNIKENLGKFWIAKAEKKLNTISKNGVSRQRIAS